MALMIKKDQELEKLPRLWQNSEKRSTITSKSNLETKLCVLMKKKSFFLVIMAPHKGIKNMSATKTHISMTKIIKFMEKLCAKLAS